MIWSYHSQNIVYPYVNCQLQCWFIALNNSFGSNRRHAIIWNDDQNIPLFLFQAFTPAYVSLNRSITDSSNGLKTWPYVISCQLNHRKYDSNYIFHSWKFISNCQLRKWWPFCSSLNVRSLSLPSDLLDNCSRLATFKCWQYLSITVKVLS